MYSKQIIFLTSKTFIIFMILITFIMFIAKVMGFDHVMTLVVKIINSIRSKAKQHRPFMVLLELSAEYGDLLLHTEIRWLSRGTVVKSFFLSLLGEIKEFMESRGEDASLLHDTEWILDLAFLTDITGKLNHLNSELQDKGKTVSDIISAVNAFKVKTNIFSVHLQRKKLVHFMSVLNDNASVSGASDRFQKSILHS